MKRNLNLLIMGGDRRYVEVINQLASRGLHISLVGFDQLDFSYSNISNKKLDQIDFGEVDAMLLPLNGTSADGEVEVLYSDESVAMSKEMLNQTPDHCVVYTGISTDYLDEAVKQAGRTLVRLTDRDDVSILNSIPTAEGALKVALEETDYTIHDAKVLVLGYGRTGVTLTRLFSAVGSRVSVAARKAGDLARIKERGLHPISMDRLASHITGFDICINTVPRLVLNADVLSNMSKTTLIIDIASKPGGTDFTYAQKNGLKAIHALGLPGKIAPKTAGEIISNVLYKLLVENE